MVMRLLNVVVTVEVETSKHSHREELSMGDEESFEEFVQRVVEELRSATDVS